MTEIIIGIDPGASGGIAVISRSGEVEVFKMPATERDLWELIESLTNGHCSFAYIEWIHPAIQKIGKSPMSKLYGNYKALRMALTAADIPLEAVQPVKWQPAMGISKRGKTETQTKWKNRLKARAQELFPPSRGIKKITLAVADALLIAEYGRRLRNGQ